MTIDLESYAADFDIPELPAGASETYIRPLAALHEATAREPLDVILLLTIRETFALYGAASATDDERDYLTEDLARIIALDPDSKVVPVQISSFLERFIEEHDPDRREVESLEWAWRLLMQANSHLHARLEGLYSTAPYAGAKSRARRRAS